MFQATSSFRPRNQQGFTLLELVVVIILISVLGVIALSRYEQWRSAAEQAAIATMIGHLRSALGLEVAQQALNGGLQILPRLQGKNPMKLLAQLPYNYQGELVSTDPKAQTPGTWYYDPEQRILVYNIHYFERDKAARAQPSRLRFRIQLIYADNNQNQRFDRRTDSIAGLDLVSLDNYRWGAVRTDTN